MVVCIWNINSTCNQFGNISIWKWCVLCVCKRATAFNIIQRCTVVCVYALYVTFALYLCALRYASDLFEVPSLSYVDYCLFIPCTLRIVVWPRLLLCIWKLPCDNVAFVAIELLKTVYKARLTKTLEGMVIHFIKSIQYTLCPHLGLTDYNSSTVWKSGVETLRRVF